MAASGPLSPPVQRSTGEADWHRHSKRDKDRGKTMQLKFTILISRCLLLLSVCLIRLVMEKKVVAMGAVLAAETVICDAPWFGNDNHKQSLEKSGAPKLPISLIRRDIAFSQQSAHRCCTSLQLFLRLAKPASL